MFTSIFERAGFEIIRRVYAGPVVAVGQGDATVAGPTETDEGHVVLGRGVFCCPHVRGRRNAKYALESACLLCGHCTTVVDVAQINLKIVTRCSVNTMTSDSRRTVVPKASFASSL